MVIRNAQDFGAGLIFIVVGAAFTWGATEYEFGTSAEPGPGYFPFCLGVLIAIVGAALVGRSLIGKEGRDGRIGAIAYKPLGIIVGSVALFGFTLPHLGLFIALPLLVVTSAMSSDEFRLREALASAAVLTGASWAVFSWGLALAIPLWPSFLR